jgi:hypothetical protein
MMGFKILEKKFFAFSKKHMAKNIPLKVWERYNFISIFVRII